MKKRSSVAVTDAIDLTVGDGDRTALLTVRGKDHDLTVVDLECLRDACVDAIERMQRKA